jgi:hypothetical protein
LVTRGWNVASNHPRCVQDERQTDDRIVAKAEFTSRLPLARTAIAVRALFRNGQRLGEDQRLQRAADTCVKGKGIGGRGFPGWAEGAKLEWEDRQCRSARNAGDWRLVDASYSEAITNCNAAPSRNCYSRLFELPRPRPSPCMGQSWQPSNHCI